MGKRPADLQIKLPLSVYCRLIEEVLPGLPKETLDRLASHLLQQDLFDLTDMESFGHYYDRVDKSLHDRSLSFKTDVAWFMFSGNMPPNEEKTFQQILEQDTEVGAVVDKFFEDSFKGLQRIGELLQEKEIELPILGIENLDRCLKVLKEKVLKLDTEAREIGRASCRERV